jgi:hypothetical protein
MSEVSFASHNATDAPPHAVVESLRGPDLTVVRIAPRPPFPEQHATRKPLPHDLDAWWDAATEALRGAA